MNLDNYLFLIVAVVALTFCADAVRRAIGIGLYQEGRKA